MSIHSHYPLISPMCNKTHQTENQQPATYPINDTNPDTNQTRFVDPLPNNYIVINNTMSDNPTIVTYNLPSRIRHAVKYLHSYDKPGLLEQ